MCAGARRGNRGDRVTGATGASFQNESRREYDNVRSSCVEVKEGGVLTNTKNLRISQPNKKTVRNMCSYSCIASRCTSYCKSMIFGESTFSSVSCGNTAIQPSILQRCRRVDICTKDTLDTVRDAAKKSCTAPPFAPVPFSPENRAPLPPSQASRHGSSSGDPP